MLVLGWGGALLPPSKWVLGKYGILFIGRCIFLVPSFEAILVQRLFCVFLASISNVSCKGIIGARIDQVYNKEESMLSAGSADRQTP